MIVRLLLVAFGLTLFAGCSAEYHARRQARYEERLRLREEQRQQRLVIRQQRMAQRCANMQGAYERGHNDGLRRREMDSSWVSQCPPEYQQEQFQWYQQGYQAGIQNAPQVQVQYTRPAVSGQVYVGVQPAGVPAVGPAVTPCTFSSDCGQSMNCRNWGGQGQICMGFGSSGAPCWFGSDCVSGWCDGGSANARTCR